MVSDPASFERYRARVREASVDISFPWYSLINKPQGYYNLIGVKRPLTVEELGSTVEWDPDYMNLVLFSTSGVHGSYQTIEQVERELKDPGVDEFGDPVKPPFQVTFFVLKPRIVQVQYGNVEVYNQQDIDKLKELRRKSLKFLIEMFGPEDDEPS